MVRDPEPVEGSSQRTVNLGGGLLVPYPSPGTAAATRIGKANRRADTKAEVRLRSALHARGLRFRKDLLIRTVDIRVHPDVVFTAVQLAVFVDGCFWHGCPEHQHVPKTNQDYWVPKLRANEQRDRRVDAALRASGWGVAWEHEDEAAAAARIHAEIDRRR